MLAVLIAHNLWVVEAARPTQPRLAASDRSAFWAGAGTSSRRAFLTRTRWCEKLQRDG